MDFISDKKFLRLSGNMLNSYYYKYVLTSDDKIVLQTLLGSFLNKGTEPYSKGLLIVNIKQKTLREKIGNITQTTCNRSLQRLNTLGIIIKLKNKAKNNRYLIGFRTEGDDNVCLIYHLINKYEQMVVECIENQRDKIKDRWKDPKIEDINSYCLNSITRNFIMRNIDESKLFLEQNENNKTLFEILFARNDYYKFKFRCLVE